MHALHVVGVDILLVRIRDCLRLCVCSLANAYTRFDEIRVLHVGKGSIEIALQHDTDILAIARIEALVEKVQRPLRVFARLHIDPNEGAVVTCTLKNLVHDCNAELLGDVEPHRGELD